MFQFKHRIEVKTGDEIEALANQFNLMSAELDDSYASLENKVAATLARGEQTLLFLNRRGYSTSLQCPKCGYVAECPNCSLSLTYHRPEQKLRCHLCGHVEPVPLEAQEPRLPAAEFLDGFQMKQIEGGFCRRDIGQKAMEVLR